jgi:AraC-like DNA-binding protein
VDEVDFVVGRPQPSLRPLITSYHGYRIQAAAGIHRGLPSRGLTLVITIDGTVDYAYAGNPVRSSHALLGGLHAEPILIHHDGYQYGIQAALTPLGVRALFQVPAGELARTVVDLDALIGAPAGELVDRLRSAKTWADRFIHLETVLSRLAAPAAVPSAEVGWAWQRLAGSRGRVEIGVLASEVGWSRQHLSAVFRREYGLTPKVTGRVMRFETAKQLLHSPLRPPLADVAARCGYADQAHFTREWHALAGCTPSTWMTEELPFVQDESVALEASSQP